MFLKVLLKGSLSLRILKIHLLKHLFLPQSAFMPQNHTLPKTLSSYYIYRFCHLLSCFSKEKLSHAIIWHDVIYPSTCDMTFRSCLTSQYLKTKFFGGFDSSFFLPRTLPTTTPPPPPALQPVKWKLTEMEVSVWKDQQNWKQIHSRHSSTTQQHVLPSENCYGFTSHKQSEIIAIEIWNSIAFLLARNW